MLTGYRRKLNESSSKVEDPAVLKLPLCLPKVKKITLHFPLGLEVVARNMKGVTIKDALDAIHKQFKKRVRISFFPSVERSCVLHVFLAWAFFRLYLKRFEQHADLRPQADDEFEKPYLAGFEWDPSECYTRFVVHQASQPTSSMSGGGGGGGKKKKNKNVIPEEGS
jgi:hypothetical protein